MKLLRYLSLFLLLVVLAGTGGWFWLLHSESGARFLFERAGNALGGGLAASAVSGSISRGLSVTDFRLQAGTTEVSADDVTIRVDIDLMPLSVEIGGTRVGNLRVQIRDAGEEKPASPGRVDAGEILDALVLPVWVLIDDLEVDGLNLGLPGAAEAIVIDRVRLAADWRERIFIDRLDVDAPRGSVRLAGSVELSGSHALDVRADVRLEPAVLADSDVAEFRLELGGELDAYTMAANGDVALADWAPHAVALAASGSVSQLDVNELSIRGEEFVVDATTAVTLGESFGVTGSLDVDRADIAVLVDQWPDGYPLRGNLDVEFQPGMLRVQDARLVIVGTDARLDAAASLDIDAGEIGAELVWQSVRWPIDADEPQVSSESGDVRLSGTPDDWQLDGTVSLAGAGFGEGTFVLDGEGDRSEAAVRIEDARLFGGRLSGFAAMNWTGRRAWSADVRLEGIETGAILPEWPGRLTGGVEASGRIEDRYVEAQVDDLNGRLAGRDFRADGGIEFDGGELTAHDLSLVHGESSFRLDGSPVSAEGLAFGIVLDDLGNYLEDADGGATASGRFSLDPAAPYARIDAAADSLRVGELYVTGLEISDRAAERDAAIAIDVSAEELSYQNSQVIGPSLVVDASPAAQSAEISASYAGMDFALALAGSFDDWRSPSTWSGTLESLVLEPEDSPAIRLLAPAALSLGREAARVDNMCLGADDESRLCVDGRRSSGGRIELSAELEALPADVVNRFVATGYDFDQRITGDLNAVLEPGRRVDGSADLTISPGRIRGEEQTELEIETATGTVAFDIRDGRLLELVLDLPLPGTGSISGDVSVSDLTEFRTSPIAGRIDFGLDDITVFGIFAPMLDSLAGSLNGHVVVAGSVGDPVLTGEAVIGRGSVDYLPLGLRLRHVDLVASLQESGYVEVSGTLQAGDGSAEISPAAVDAEGRREGGVGIRIVGENLTVIDVPDVRAVADVDMTVGFNGDALTLGGSLAFPRAVIEPERLPASKQTVSDDVVIVRGELPGEIEADEETGIGIYGTLDVALGPDVQVRLDVASASVSGETTFEWSGDPVPMADGRYLVSGEIEAFGILLEIDEGAVRFPNVPADEPQLRIRAERQIFGNSEVRSAGVLVEGTLQRPNVAPYSVPATNKERALTLLVTGSDFNFEQGVGAIDFGTYIAPRLFVSYGVDLFGRDNVISARYDLTKGFGIRATSGQRESGVDLIYRFER